MLIRLLLFIRFVLPFFSYVSVIRYTLGVLSIEKKCEREKTVVTLS